MKLNTIIETCSEPIIVYDKQGRVTYVNPGFERVFAWSGKEIMSRRIDFVPKDQLKLTEKAVARVMAGKTVSGLETQRKTKHGDTLHVRVSAAPFMDENNTYDGMVVTLQDITDLVASRQEALAANQAKDEFLSNLSHEVRTPMNHVMGMIELLHNTRLDDDQIEFMEILQKSAGALMTVVNDLLDYASIEGGKMACDAIGFDLRTLVEKVKKSMVRKSAEKGLGFTLFVHQFVPSLLMGDPGRLRQVLVNLCSNAIKFTEKGEVNINIFLEKEDDRTAEIRFEILDTGIGIAPELTRVIFDSFSQADGSATREYGGSGLGLSISNKLVQMMGSTIEVKSIPGKGSCFFFTLSLDKQPPTIQKNRVSPMFFNRKKILAVDENSTDLRVLKTLSRDWDCLFDEADTPEVSFEKLKKANEQKRPFDIILLNMQLPGIGGEALAKKIKTLPGGMDYLIIMLATIGKRGDVERLKKIGVSGYLPKPIKSQELYDCIAMALAARGSGQDEMITRHTLGENQKQRVRVLLIETGRVNRKIVLNILGKSGYGVTAKTDEEGVIDAFKTGKYNLILLDIDSLENRGLVHRIRQQEKEMKKERVPILAMTETPLENKMEGPYRVSVDHFLSKPLTPAGLLAAIETWSWQSEIFLRDHVGGYSRMNSQKKQGIVFNLKAALERAMDDKEFLEMLVTEFAESLSAKINAIKEAASKKDMETLILTAQSLKGSSANMGADMITAAAQAIEKMGEQGDLGLAENRIKQLATASSRFKEHITTIKWGEV